MICIFHRLNLKVNFVKKEDNKLKNLRVEVVSIDFKLKTQKPNHYKIRVI